MKVKLLASVFAIVTAAALGNGAASSAPPAALAEVRLVGAACDSIGATATWDRLRVGRVTFTYLFDSTGPYTQTRVLNKPARAGTVSDRLVMTTTMPFSNGRGSVRAEFFDARGMLAASSSVPFELSGC